MQSPVTVYHDCLTPDIAAETATQLDRELRSRQLVFGNRALCTVLRPRLITVAELMQLQQRVRAILRAFRTAYDRALKDASFRAQFGLESWEEELIHADPGFPEPSPTSRLDFFWVPETGALGLTEYNAETPAGAAYNDELSAAFIDLPAMRAFARHYEILPLPARAGVIGALLDTYRVFAGAGKRPRVAILDWDDVPTRTEFVLYQSAFAALGVHCVIADPRACDYRGGKLWLEGAPVDLIYKRVLITELVERCGLDHDVVSAVRERAVCMVDGFRCKILHKKASLAMLSDEANAAMFNDAERAAIADCIPWTRVVHERATTYKGRQVDLVSFIHERREQLVLKPSDAYGGEGVVLGWNVDDAVWGGAIRHALGSPHIVQERVAIPSESYPSWTDSGVEFADRMLDTAPFVTHGDYMEGLLTRLSTAALLNVTAGGGSTVPTFVVVPR
ncbi:MAG TPA: hypothetical protein VJ717_18635 [Gemmatimonadaceae bacterium]|nr:hypothetical protein [Gemmatimonadaceae bacterium]